MSRVDIRVENHGSLFLLRPVTARGHEAIDAVIEGNTEVQTLGGAIAVEPRYVSGLVAQLKEDFGVRV